MNWQELMGLVATTGRQAREDVAGYFKPTTDLFNPNAIDPKVYRNIDQQPYTLKENQEARKFGAIRKLPITNKEILGRALKGGAGLGDVIPTSAIGTGALAGMAKVFHGSPHLFKKFRTDKIGTGEGAQAYGHGLYFAENPNVAKNYVPRDFDFEKVLMGHYKQAERNQDYRSMEVYENAMMHEMPSELRARYVAPDYSPEDIAHMGKAIDKVQETAYEAGHLYKADIPDDQIKKLLDWDKPLSEQPESVRKALEAKNILGDFSHKNDYGEVRKGADYFGRVKDRLGSLHFKKLRDEMSLNELGGGLDEATSKYLNNLGIPGIKYLDQGSRQAGKGTRNYVVFDEKLPTLEEINNKPIWRRSPKNMPIREGLKPSISQETATNENLLVYLDEPGTQQMMDRFGKERLSKSEGFDVLQGENNSWRYLARNKSGEAIGVAQGVDMPDGSQVLSNFYTRPDVRGGMTAGNLFNKVRRDKSNLTLDRNLTKQGARFFGLNK